MEEIVELVQPQAEKLGHACHIAPAYITNFAEEVRLTTWISALSKRVLFYVLTTFTDI